MDRLISFRERINLDPLRREVKLNHIDNQVKDALINTAKKCRKYRTGEINFSPETSKAGKVWHFWKMLIRFKLCSINCLSAMINLASKLNINDFMQLSTYEIKMKMTLSKQACLKLKYSDSYLREKHILPTQQKSKLRTEKLSRRHELYSKTFGKRKLTAFRKVDYKAYGCVIRVASQQRIEQAIIKENSNRFVLAYSSLLL